MKIISFQSVGMISQQASIIQWKMFRIKIILVQKGNRIKQ